MTRDDLQDVPEFFAADEHSVGLVETHLWTPALGAEGFALDCGRSLPELTLAYETYGELSPQGDNAVLLLHALSGDAHVAGVHAPTDRKAGWWDIMVGPGKPYDTDQYYVICSNIVGGCKGSTGPSSLNPATGRPWGLSFPIVTIGDMVRAQRLLMDHLGIARLLAVSGGSMGGFQALDWAVRYPERVASVHAIATAARLSTQAIAFDEVGRQAITADPAWANGAYYDQAPPRAGLSIARMIGHITYLSEEQMHSKFGRRLQGRDSFSYDFETDFQVESYLRHQGSAFVDRFDANSYLYITKAMDYYDLANGHHSLVEAMEGVQAYFLVVSFTSDWLFPTHQSKEIVRALQANGVPTTFMEIPSQYGHDSFLLPSERLVSAVTDFLASAQRAVREAAQRGEGAA
ncbi:MAG: homoserine O-acetyltransferase [Chloroflexota bacterium]